MIYHDLNHSLHQTSVLHLSPRVLQNLYCILQAVTSNTPVATVRKPGEWRWGMSDETLRGYCVTRGKVPCSSRIVAFPCRHSQWRFDWLMFGENMMMIELGACRVRYPRCEPISTCPEVRCWTMKGGEQHASSRISQGPRLNDPSFSTSAKLVSDCEQSAIHDSLFTKWCNR